MRRTTTLLLSLAVLATMIPAVTPAALAADGDYRATIRRTGNGIPHVLADSYGDMGFGIGYAFAQDNICTAADFYVTVNGERSKYFGPDAGWLFRGNGSSVNNRNSDFFYTAVNESGIIESLLAEPPPAGPLPGVFDGVRGYVAGYNSYLEDVGGPDGISDPRCKGKPWVRPITEMDAYRRFFQLASLASAGVAINEIGGAQPPAPDAASAFGSFASEQALVDAQTQLLRQLPGRLSEAIGIGSNAYGLGGEATANGKGMVLGNPHFPWHGGERLYQMHLTIPGVLDVSGAALYGVPLVLIGHTAGVAWSHTVSTAYRFTPFELTLVPGSPTTYLVDGQPMEMERQQVTIEVADEGGNITEESRTLYKTVYGPMLTGILGLPIFPWTPARAFALGDANVHLRYLNQFFTWNHAQSTQEMYELQKEYLGIPWVNTIAADSAGKAYYADISVVPNVPDSKTQVCNTEVGLAATAALGLPVLDGARSDCNWDTDEDAPAPGIFGPGNLPHLFRDDYVANGNDSYWLSNPQEPLEGFARIIGDERTERTLRTRLGIKMIEERLAGQDEYTDEHPNRFTQDILQDVVFNNRQHAGELTKDDLAAFCSSLGGTTLSSDGPVATDGACEALANWDGRDNLDSNGAILFRRFWSNLQSYGPPVAVTAPTGDKVGIPWTTTFDADDAVNTPNTLNTLDPRVAISLGDAINDLEGAGIPLDAPLRGWQYENRGDGEQIPIHGGPGGLGVFNAINVSWNSSRGFPDVSHGSSFVMAAHFVDPKTNRGCPVDADAIVTYSQSEDITSPWFKDQTRMYSVKEWNPMHFCQSEIMSDPDLQITKVSTSTKGGPGKRGGKAVAAGAGAAAEAGSMPATGGGAAAFAILCLAGAALTRRRGR